MTSGKGGGYERMLLDSIILCIAYLTSVSQEVLLSMATMGRDGWKAIGLHFNLYCYLDSSIEQFFLEVLLIKPELFVLPR
jgi:hypothetical protein